MSEALTPEEANRRFHYVEPPFPLPGKCAVCGNVRRPVIDFGANVDPYGAVLLCIACVAEAYEILAREGLVEVPQTPTLKELRDSADRLNDEFGTYTTALASLLDDYLVLLSRSNEQVARRESQDTIGPPKVSGRAAAKSDEPASDSAGNEGSASVPSNHGSGTVFRGI